MTSQDRPKPQRVYVTLSGRDGHRYANLYTVLDDALAHFHTVTRFDPDAEFRVLVKRSNAPKPAPAIG